MLQKKLVWFGKIGLIIWSSLYSAKMPFTISLSYFFIFRLFKIAKSSTTVSSTSYQIKILKLQNPWYWHVMIVSIDKRVKRGEKGNGSHLQVCDLDILFFILIVCPVNSRFQALFYFRDSSLYTSDHTYKDCQSFLKALLVFKYCFITFFVKITFI